MSASGEELRDGSVIGIVGAGPAACFFALLALKEAEGRGIRVHPVLFDGKSFLAEGPKGCNMCAGVISSRLCHEMERQLGLTIPPDRVQRLIRDYVFHTREGSHLVIPPAGNGPVPVVFRGNGPRFSRQQGRISFDDYLLGEVLKRGGSIVRSFVESLSFPDRARRRPQVLWPGGKLDADLVVVASGVTSLFGKKLPEAGPGYRFPRCVRAFQAELDLGTSAVEGGLGDSIHVFSLGLRDIRFAAIIPKSRYATVSLVGNRDLGHEHLGLFLESPVVRRLFPADWRLPDRFCWCRPRLPVTGARRFYGNRLVMVGDASMCRYYKNGIESAFQTAGQAVRAAFRHGVDGPSLRRFYYAPVRRQFVPENLYARVLFQLNDFVASKRFWVRAHLDVVRRRPEGRTAQTLHHLTWNLFTGSSRYRDIFWMSLNPRFSLQMILTGIRLLLLSRCSAAARDTGAVAILRENESRRKD